MIDREISQHDDALIFGCMGLGSGSNANPVSTEDARLAHAAVDAALAGGIRTFDHADIYARGKAEQVFGTVLSERPGLRDQIRIQSKCAIRFEDSVGPKRYDFSASWLAQSVDGSLSRLGTDRLDCLLLHRPDPLMVIDELCRTLEDLHQQGKVLQLGVSNMYWYQVDYLANYLDLPIVANQLELSLSKLDWLDESLFAGDHAGSAVQAFPGTLEYCQRHDVQIQAWGSLAQGLYSGGRTPRNQADVATTELIAKLAKRYQVSAEAIVLAWLMRHPAEIVPVIGTTNTGRIQACCKAPAICLSREEWYALYVTARGSELP